MGLLDGGIAKAIYAGFKGKLLAGSLRKESAIGGLDEYGDPVATVPVLYTCEGFTDKYSEFFKSNAGIPDTDLKVCVFAQSMPGIRPEKDDKILMGGAWYQIRKVSTDPATALWECQAYSIEAPVDGS